MIFSAKISTAGKLKLDAKNLDAALEAVSHHLVNEGDNAHVWSAYGKYVHVIERCEGTPSFTLPNFKFNSYSIELLAAQ